MPVSGGANGDTTALLARVRAIATEHGAVLRAASAESDSLARDRMTASFARGDLETWRYTDAYARAASDPATILSGARSVLCIALPYATKAPREFARAPMRGRISNYAWSPDYHVVVRKVLAAIARELDAFAGEPVTRIACDTAPLAERAFAERSGLAWIGKHTNAIVPGAGSFVFLGEVVTTLAFTSDAPLKKTCGNCSRCVDACPTGALRGDYTIDARRCISDLTQRLDAIPLELRPLVGEWIWGCDLCQDVCPPTRRAPLSPHAARTFAAVDPDFAFPDLLALLSLRSSTYRKRYKRLGLGWRGAAILRRNAAVALGNRLDRAAVSALETSVTNDPHPIVRGHAAWALGRLGSARAITVLERRMAAEGDANARLEIEGALERALFRKV